VLDDGKVVGNGNVSQTELPLQVLQEIDDLRLNGYVEPTPPRNASRPGFVSSLFTVTARK